MVKQCKLSNGITVALEKMDYLKSVSCCVWVKSGSAYEAKQENGMAHMVEHMLFQGTKRRSAKQLADDMAGIGGNMNAYTTKECTVFYVTTLKEHLNSAMDILGDMLCESVFDGEAFQKEKGVVLDEIEMYEDSPEDMVHEMMQNSVWEGHPLGFLISGTRDIVSGFTGDRLVEFAKELYTADNLYLSVAGNFAEDEALNACEQAFGSIPPSRVFRELTEPEYIRSFYTREQDIEQLHMNMAFPGITLCSKERYVFAVSNLLLGGSESSRLFQKIREELGMSYSVFSYGSPYRKAGLWHIDMTVNPNNLLKTCECTLEILEQIQKEGCTQEELSRIKEQLKAELILGSESAKNRAQRNGKAMLYEDDMVPIEKTIEQVAQIQPDDVRSFLQKYIDPSKVSLAFVGRIAAPQIKQVRTLFEGL